MSDVVLKISDLGKCYKFYRSNIARFASWFGSLAKPTDEYWALKDVSFTLRRGEALAIIGQNGAGKSTLLKLITGTIRSTTGAVKVNGRISAILELGLGFNPYFTGRQNVYLAGGLMGLSTAEISELIPGVKEFADIGDFFEQPLHIYSSGMQARLAFAIATANRPEVLIVDEVLSVGDAAFQRKCFRRIEDFRTEGTTLLFVTHDMETTKRICKRAIWLNKGKAELFGDSKSVCEAYEKHLFGRAVNKNIEKLTEQKIGSIDPSLDTSGIELSYGGVDAQIKDFAIYDRYNQVINVVPMHEPFSIQYRVHFNVSCKDVNFGMMIKTVDGLCIYAFNTSNYDIASNFKVGDIANVSFELNNYLAAGTYYINCGVNHICNENRIFLHRRLDVGILRVITGVKFDSMGGVVNLKANPSVVVKSLLLN